MADFSTALAAINASAGPTLIAVAGSGDDERSPPPHSHSRGQLFASTRGLVTVGLDSGMWVLPTTHAVWVPPHHRHWAGSHGPFQGFVVYVAEDHCATLPAQPCSIRLSNLLRGAVLRAATWPVGALEAGAERIAAVILDEIRTLPVDALELPMPREARLNRIAQALIAAPDDGRSLEEWAAWAAIGARTLSRRFVDETGFTFTAWRQRARLLRALAMLADGYAVTRIALELGYSTPSTFIALFKRAFGVTPAVYRTRIGIE